MDFIDKFKQELSEFAVSEDQAREFLVELSNLHDYIENTLSEVGVKHQLDVYLGNYGYGRSLVLEDCEADWNDYQAGDWIPSSAGC